MKNVSSMGKNFFQREFEGVLGETFFEKKVSPNPIQKTSNWIK